MASISPEGWNWRHSVMVVRFMMAFSGEGREEESLGRL